MMKDFVQTWSDKNPTTKDFQTVVERHMIPALDLAGDGRMDYFFRQWVDGTDVPIHTAKLDISKEGDQYRIKGGDRVLNTSPSSLAISIFRHTRLQAPLVSIRTRIPDVLLAISLGEKDPQADATCHLGIRCVEAFRSSNRDA